MKLDLRVTILIIILGDGPYGVSFLFVKENKKMKKKITLTTGEEFILNLPATDNDYRLLGRLKEDCEYYLGYGSRQNKHLYYKDEEKMIVAITEIYDSLVEKPEWLTMSEIAAYEEQMLHPNLG